MPPLLAYVSLVGMWSVTTALVAPVQRTQRCALRRAIAEDAAAFELCAKSAGIEHDALRLEASGDDGRRVYSAFDVDAGATLLVVPAALCVTAHRSGVVGGLLGQTDAAWDACGDLRIEVGETMFRRGATWDVRLAVGVLEACSGAGGDFWDAYSQLLPARELLAHPLVLSPQQTAELEDDQLEGRAELQRRLLRDCYPLLYTEDARLDWAYALVTSRCFSMADGDTFAFVPFLDLCDHAEVPAADFTSDAAGNFVLRAVRPLAAGEPVTVCYGQDYDSSRLFWQYGFVPEEGTAADKTLLLSTVASACDAAICADVGPSLAPQDVERLQLAFARASPLLASRARRSALFDALFDDDGVSAAALLDAARWRLRASSTTLAEDEATASGELTDVSRAALGYRLARKRQLTLAVEVLADFLSETTPEPPLE